MCESGFYLYKNKCYNQCPRSTYKITKNNICVDKPECDVNNCEECENEMCKKCLHGFYLFENKCLESCPEGLRANRSNFTCVKKDEFHFNMVFPSKGSCKNNCGLKNKVNDCYCSFHCLKDGNCCDDFDTECEHEIGILIYL